MSNKESYIQTGKDRFVGKNLRLLDFDDLYLLRHLLDGLTVAATARKLGLTQPAITQRIRKIERVFEDSIIRKVGRHIQLTPLGEFICAKAADALVVMQDVVSKTFKSSSTIVANHFLAHHRLWRAMQKTYKADSESLIHIRIAPEKSSFAMLNDGHVDAIMTSNAANHSTFSSIELFEEEQIMVAAPAVARGIDSIEILKEHLLVEIDPSYSSLKNLSIELKSELKFKDAWFLGSKDLVLNSLLLEMGVGILPQTIVQSHIESGKLVQLLPELELGREKISLLYRDPSFPMQIDALLKAF